MIREPLYQYEFADDEHAVCEWIEQHKKAEIISITITPSGGYVIFFKIN